MWRFRRQMFAFESKNHVLKTDQVRAQSLGVCYKIGDATDDTFIKIGDSLGEEKLKLKVLNLILAFSHGFLPFSNRFLQIFIILVRRWFAVIGDLSFRRPCLLPCFSILWLLCLTKNTKRSESSLDTGLRHRRGRTSAASLLRLRLCAYYWIGHRAPPQSGVEKCPIPPFFRLRLTVFVLLC